MGAALGIGEENTTRNKKKKGGLNVLNVFTEYVIECTR